MRQRVKLSAEGNRMNDKEQIEELVQALEEMVGRYCGDPTETDYVDSHGGQENADAIRLLAKHGRIRIVDELRHSVIGRWVA